MLLLLPDWVSNLNRRSVVGKLWRELKIWRLEMGFCSLAAARDFDQVRKLTAAVPVRTTDKQTREDRIRTAHSVSQHHGNVFSSDWDGNTQYYTRRW